MSKKILCGTGKEFEWKRTDPLGNDIKITYSCGGKIKTSLRNTQFWSKQVFLESQCIACHV